MCEIGITLRASIASSPEDALATLRDLPKVHVVRFEKLTFLFRFDWFPLVPL